MKMFEERKTNFRSNVLQVTPGKQAVLAHPTTYRCERKKMGFTYATKQNRIAISAAQTFPKPDKSKCRMA